jgi:hypothetical protein
MLACRNQLDSKHFYNNLWVWFGKSRRLLPISAMMLKDFTGHNMDVAADAKRAAVHFSHNLYMNVLGFRVYQFVTCVGNAGCRR